MRDRYNWARRVQPHGLRRSVEMDKVYGVVAYGRTQFQRQTVEVAGAAGHPVQRRIQPGERRERPCLFGLLLGWLRPQTGEHNAVAAIDQFPAEIKRIAPYSAHGVDGHQDAALAWRQCPQHAASSSASGRGRFSWMSLNFWNDAR